MDLEDRLAYKDLYREISNKNYDLEGMLKVIESLVFNAKKENQAEYLTHSG